jgi:hypothetical protein
MQRSEWRKEFYLPQRRGEILGDSFCACASKWFWKNFSMTEANPKKSIFRQFMAVLRKHWKEKLPFVQPFTEPRGLLPKASSFYAGKMANSGFHVYLNFQHSNKAWEVGQFTINVVFTLDEHNPKMYSIRTCGPYFCLEDGYYRIGFLIGSKDKWWHLKQGDDPIITLAWRPSSYENTDAVISQAVDDVTRDVISALILLNVQSAK